MTEFETDMRKALRANLTLVAALVVAAISLVLLVMGKLEPSRAFTAIVFASCLAAHSADQERRYRREIITALQGVADVGVRMRLGDRAGAVRVAEQACTDVEQELADDRQTADAPKAG